MSSAIAQGRLREERKLWRRDHPIGFWAKPLTNPDGSEARNAHGGSSWEAGIPGKAGTDWEGGVYKVLLEFSDEFPSRPPKCKRRLEDEAQGFDAAGFRS
jgi:ubiquitin-conjugating enzyme E2 I